MLREVRFIPVEHTRDDDDGPDEAYFMASGVANVYVVGSGLKATEATAYLSDLGSSVFALDTVDEDRLLYLTADNIVGI
jgi:hypothetical protein